LKLLLADIFFI